MSEFLLQLVQSMNKSEKRNFLSSLKSSKRRDAYYLLFDALNQSKVYDSKLIQEQFENLEAKEFKEMKYRLQEKIIDYLATYDLESGPRLKVEQLRVKAMVLEKRGFIKEAIVNFEKARKLAERYEFFSELFKIYPALTRYYLYFVSDFQSIKKGLAIVKVWSAYANSYSENQRLRVDAALEYRTYLEKNKLISKNEGEDMGSYSVDRPKGFSVRTVKAEINLFKAINSDSEKKILQANKQSLKIFEDSIYYKEANIVSYTTTLINAISQSISINRLKDLNYYKESLASIQYSGIQQKVEGGQLKYYGLLVIFLIQSDFVAFKELAEDYRKDDLIQNSQGDITMSLVIQSLLIYNEFAQSKFDTCWDKILVWLNMDGEKHATVDEIIYIKCVLAICQLEANEPEQCRRTLQAMSQKDLARLENKRMVRFITILKSLLESLCKSDNYKSSIAYEKLQKSYVHNAFQDYLIAEWLSLKMKLPRELENRILKSKEKGFIS